MPGLRFSVKGPTAIAVICAMPACLACDDDGADSPGASKDAAADARDASVGGTAGSGGLDGGAGDRGNEGEAGSAQGGAGGADAGPDVEAGSDADVRSDADAEADAGSEADVASRCTGAPPPALTLTHLFHDSRSPVLLLSEPADASRLYVMELTGRIARWTGGSNLVAFLDIVNKVTPKATNSEMGAVGFAFHPNYGRGSERRFYVHYHALDDTSTISEFSRSPTDPNTADPASEKKLVTLAQSALNHKGGTIAFGPDGYLYAAFGDGGGSGQAQDPAILYGKLLRIDVDAHPTPPAGHPMAAGYHPNVVHLGLRNPWRWSIDRPTGDLYLTDVGGDLYEEVNVVSYQSGPKNFGWPIAEGPGCVTPPCDLTRFTAPTDSYAHQPTGGNAISGGYVYRGTKIPGLFGRYLYADIYSTTFWSFVWNGQALCDKFQVNVALPDGGLLNAVSFGQDANGELYLVGGYDLFRIDPK